MTIPPKKTIRSSRYLTLPTLKFREGSYKSILDKSLNVIEDALRIYSRVYAVRIDLRLPYNFNHFDTGVITRFMKSLKAQLNASFHVKCRSNASYVHKTELFFIWVREMGSNSTPHYHVCILLNGNAYRSLGEFNLSNNNLYSKINKAWLSALGHEYQYCNGLVHIPENAEYFLERGKPKFDMIYRSLFKRISYFAKVRTKHNDYGFRTFGTSRIKSVVT